MTYYMTNNEHEFLIKTDDYSKSEVDKGILKRNLLKDVKNCHFKTPYLILDSEYNIIEVITMM